MTPPRALQAPEVGYYSPMENNIEACAKGLARHLVRQGDLLRLKYLKLILEDLSLDPNPIAKGSSDECESIFNEMFPSSGQAVTVKKESVHSSEQLGQPNLPSGMGSDRTPEEPPVCSRLTTIKPEPLSERRRNTQKIIYLSSSAEDESVIADAQIGPSTSFAPHGRASSVATRIKENEEMKKSSPVKHSQGVSSKAVQIDLGSCPTCPEETSSRMETTEDNDDGQVAGIYRPISPEISSGHDSPEHDFTLTSSDEDKDTPEDPPVRSRDAIIKPEPLSGRRRTVQRIVYMSSSSETSSEDESPAERRPPKRHRMVLRGASRSLKSSSPSSADEKPPKRHRMVLPSTSESDGSSSSSESEGPVQELRSAAPVLSDNGSSSSLVPSPSAPWRIIVVPRSEDESSEEDGEDGTGARMTEKDFEVVMEQLDNLEENARYSDGGEEPKLREGPLEVEDRVHKEEHDADTEVTPFPNLHSASEQEGDSEEDDHEQEGEKDLESRDYSTAEEIDALLEEFEEFEKSLLLPENKPQDDEVEVPPSPNLPAANDQDAENKGDESEEDQEDLESRDCTTTNGIDSMFEEVEEFQESSTLPEDGPQDEEIEPTPFHLPAVNEQNFEEEEDESEDDQFSEEEEDLESRDYSTAEEIDALLEEFEEFEKSFNLPKDEPQDEEVEPASLNSLPAANELMTVMEEDWEERELESPDYTTAEGLDALLDEFDEFMKTLESSEKIFVKQECDSSTEEGEDVLGTEGAENGGIEAIPEEAEVKEEDDEEDLPPSNEDEAKEQEHNNEEGQEIPEKEARSSLMGRGGGSTLEPAPRKPSNGVRTRVYDRSHSRTPDADGGFTDPIDDQMAMEEREMFELVQGLLSDEEPDEDVEEAESSDRKGEYNDEISSSSPVSETIASSVASEYEADTTEDDSDTIVAENDDTGESGMDDDDQVQITTRKRKTLQIDSESGDGARPAKRRKKKLESEEDEDLDSESDAEGLLDDCETNWKKIRSTKIMSDADLSQATLEAKRREFEKRERLQQKEREFSQVVLSQRSHLTSLTLDLDANSDYPCPVEVDPELARQLKPHQVEGIQFMYGRAIESLDRLEEPGGGGILAHCMGLGKTFQVVAFLHTILTHPKIQQKIRKVLIVVPKNVVINWKSEFKKWLVSDRTIRVTGFDSSHSTLQSRLKVLEKWSSASKPSVLIISYNMVRRMATRQKEKTWNRQIREQCISYLFNPDLVVCDEAHELKNNKTALYTVMKDIATTRKICLTGTPMQNNLLEYYNMVDFINPNLLGTEHEFRNKYMNPIQCGSRKDSNVDEVKLMKKQSFLLANSLKNCIHRRNHRLLFESLPPKLEYVVKVKMAHRQRLIYLAFMRFLKGHNVTMKKLGRMIGHYNRVLLLTAHPHPFVADLKDRKDDSVREEEGDETIAGTIADFAQKMKEKLPEDAETSLELSNKLVVLMELIKKCEQVGDKLLIFSQRRPTLQLIGAMLGHLAANNLWYLDGHKALHAKEEWSWKEKLDYCVINGDTRMEQRDAIQERFNDENERRLRLMLISTKAGCLGTNLVGANRVVIFDVSWNPANDTQALFRVCRYGQKKPTYIYRLVAADSLEEVVYKRQVNKLSTSKRVVDEEVLRNHFRACETDLVLEEEEVEEQMVTTDAPPKDRLLLELMEAHPEKIKTCLEHESLFHHQEEEELTEQEKKIALEDEKKEQFRQGQNQGNSISILPLLSMLEGPSGIPAPLASGQDQVQGEVDGDIEMVPLHNLPSDDEIQEDELVPGQGREEEENDDSRDTIVRLSQEFQPLLLYRELILSMRHRHIVPRESSSE
uniref:LisH domain-containing protein n=1 Tax=Steinernema glaseri TaxID=37863 RepID=A0A1I7YUB0_9BILA